MRITRRGRLATTLVVAATAYVAADAVDVAPGVLTTSPAPRPTPAPTPTATAPADPSPAPPTPVLPALAATAAVPTGLAAALGPALAAPALGGRVSAYAVDALSGRVLLDVGARRAMVPASTTKLVTAAATLRAVGAGATLATRVVQGGSPEEVVLVGAGDMLLAPGRAATGTAGRAGLDELAGQVAASLRGEGQERVVVRFDDSLFAGPNVPPPWRPADVAAGYTGRVAALGLATDRARPGRPSSTDPAATAARAFTAALVRAGVGVSGVPQRAVAPAGARVLGVVRSAPVGDVLDLALTESDNALAEVLARLTALAAGRPATEADAADAVLDQVGSLGVDVAGAALQDASGLARGNALSARSLGQLLRLAASGEQPRLTTMLDGLPVAGLTGTLAGRYGTTRTSLAAGLLRAKTGTLTGTSTLAGTVVDRDGRLLVLVVMADRVPASGTLAARAALDRVATAAAGCGCR